MVARPGTKQANFNSGEVSREIYGRFDLKSYYASAALMQGFEPTPQGGFVLMPGMRDIAYAGRMMTTIFTAAPAAVVGVVGPQLLAVIDLGSAQAVAGLDLTGFLATLAIDGGLSANVTANPAVDGSIISGPLDIAATARTRRIAYAPGGPVTGRYIRIKSLGTPSGASTVTLGSIAVLSESFGLLARSRPFSAKGGRALTLLLAPGHVDIFRDGAYVGCAAFPYSSGQLPDVQVTQRFDTAFFWHAAVAPRRLVRVKNDNDWLLDAAPFQNIPNVDLGGTYTNGVAEAWDVYLTYTGTFGGQTFALDVNGERTPSIDIPAGGGHGGADWPGTAALIQAALNALPSSAGGITVTATDKIGVAIFAVVFDGASKGSTNSITGEVVSSTDGAITAGRKVNGLPPGEPIMSVTQGYPVCGAFDQDRLLLGGFAGKTSALGMSQTAEYFQLNTQIAAADGPILDNLDTDGDESIVQIARSKFLVVLTTRDIYFLSSRTIDRTVPRNYVASESVGTNANIPVVTKSEGGIIFANPEATMLLQGQYSEVDQGFTADPISLLASHILAGTQDAPTSILDMARQRPNDETDAQRLWIPRDDGVLVEALIIRNQDVTAFVRKVTDGAVLSASVDAANVVNLVVQRTIAGAPRLTYERLERGLLLDQAVTIAIGAPLTVVPNLGRLEGATIWAINDGYVEGPFTVTGGSITLGTACTTSLTVGRWTAPLAQGLPLSKVINGTNVVLNRPCRVHTLDVDLLDTTSIAVGANGQRPRDQPLQRFGDPIDTPPTPFTGLKRVSAIKGFTQEGFWQVTQVRPGRCRVRSITPEAKT